MRFVFAADALQDPQHWHSLDRILLTVDDGWHEWQIDDPETLEASPWLQGSNRPLLRKLYEQATVRSTYPSAGHLHRQSWVVSLSAAPGTLAPPAAAHFLGRALCVCVENRFTDGLFLDAILDLLAPEEFQVFLGRCEVSPIKCDSGGGFGELPKIIEAHVQELAALGLPPRAVVFADSDARFPGDVSKGAETIAKSCQTHAIAGLILSKRAIENYIPDEVLQGWAAEPDNQAARPRVAAVCRLTPEQRDHLAMKKKFPQQFETEQERGLFASVPPTDAALMRECGFKDDLIERLKTHRQNLSAEALRRRDGKGELDHLVNMIIDAL
jgi:hypothetical protein